MEILESRRFVSLESMLVDEVILMKTFLVKHLIDLITHNLLFEI